MNRRNIKNQRILRILLNHPDATLTKYRIAKLANCSTPWVIEFIKKLEKKHLLKNTKVIAYDKLIDLFITISKKNKSTDFFVQNPKTFIKKQKLEYALTTYGAENLLTHQLFPTRYDIYIKEQDYETWKTAILKQGLIGKGNLRLTIDDDHVFFNAKKIKGLTIVSIPQLLIDLKKEGGVAMESYNLVKKHVQGH